MADNIKKGNFNPKFNELAKLENELKAVISNFSGDVSLAGTIGVLEMIKVQLIADAMVEVGDD